MLKILVASADPDFLSAVSRPLAATKDFHVTWAYDGFDIRTMAAESDFAGIIMDLILPGPPVGEICRELRANKDTADIPVLLIAESLEELTAEKTAELGASDFLKKPIFSVTLLKKVRELMSEGRQSGFLADRTNSALGNKTVILQNEGNEILSRIYKRVDRHIDFERDIKTIERVNLILSGNVNVLAYKDLFALDIATAIDMFRMANSIVLGSQSKVAGFSTVLQRIGLIGISENYARLARKKHKTNPTAQALIREHFSFHSLLTACLTEEISALSGRFNHSELYSAGLFHDIGKLFFISYYPDLYQELTKTNPDWKCGLSAAENRSFGIDHADLGAMIFQKLGFSRIIQDACLHDKIVKDQKNSFQNPKSIRIVHTASALSHLLLEKKSDIDLYDDYFEEIKEIIAEFRISLKIVVENSIKRTWYISNLLKTTVAIPPERAGRIYDVLCANRLKKKSPSAS